MAIVVPAPVAGCAGELFVSSLPLNAISPTAVLKSSAQAVFPAENVPDYLHPERVWKPATNGDEWVGLDLGQPQEGWLFAGWITLNGAASFSLQGSDSADFGSLVFDQEISAALARHPLTRRAAYALQVPTAARYVRVSLPTHSGLPCTVGQLVFVSTGLLVTQRSPSRLEVRQAVSEQTFLSGGRQVVAVGPPQVTLGLDWDWAYHYFAQGDGNENAVFEDPNIFAAPADPLLVIPDRLYRKHWAMIARRASGAMGFASQQGIGAQLSLTYEEIIGGD